MDSVDPTFQSMRVVKAIASGVSPKTLRGPQWERPCRGVVRPTEVENDEVLTRISDAVALLGRGSQLGGWAALRVQGNTWFDGIESNGSLRDLLLHCGVGSQLRVRRGIRPSEGLVYPDEVISLENYEVTTLARAAYDEMRLANGLRAAVVVLEMAISTTTGMPHTSMGAIAKVIDSHHKTRGIVQARRALDLGSSRSASPWETRTRLIAQLDADLPDLVVNAPVFDLNGSLLGIADLLDPISGLVIESDGAGHREAVAHSDDNIREEKFERSGLVVVRATAIDHGDRFAVSRRMRDAQRDATRETKHDWTLEKPDWWWRWAPGRRWD